MYPYQRIPARSRSRSVVAKHPNGDTFQGVGIPPPLLKTKPASEWVSADLKTLNIHMIPMKIEAFFGCKQEDLPKPQFTHPFLEEILTAGFPFLANDGSPPKDLFVHNYFELIHNSSASLAEATVDLLAFDTMKHLGYQLLSPGDVASLSMQHQLYFEMSGDKAGARVDVALLNKIKALLCLYVEDKKLKPTVTDRSPLTWPHAQVIAHAFGAYNANMNDARQEALKVSEEDADYLAYEHLDMVIPAFSFLGSTPCFYIIPITAALASAVARGEYPPHATSVFFCEVPLAAPYLGMIPRNQRYLILQAFEAFKKFIPTDFSQLCRFSAIDHGRCPGPIDPKFKYNVWDWVCRFLWESEERCRSRGIDKASYATACTNYFVGSNAFNDERNHHESAPAPRSPQDPSTEMPQEPPKPRDEPPRPPGYPSLLTHYKESHLFTL